ncbi:uncharacterized protein BXZ73DRAFT_47840 [Epithele typhae]|uniref:uncharacterized protein n=1 Tax=Epithele typhae TaxID=378194 RepID=UPI00200789D5|nr:uncharacterized protein BXZ73DRAFT_47840 [Epithele typhae]KAH9929850.1 hypothetical protein BXZ73DRAFT_47840 [Epithele typhae]
MPKCKLFTPKPGLHKKIVGALVTRFDIPGKRGSQLVQKHLPKDLLSWAKLRILNGGDVIQAASIKGIASDTRDRTFVRYQTFIDKNSRKKKKAPEFQLETFYGRLIHIFSISFDTPSSIADLRLDSPTKVILAVIKPCIISSTNNRLDIHYYSEQGSEIVLDLKCIQCVVGRVPIPPGGFKADWAIVDRSGSLARALEVDD